MPGLRFAGKLHFESASLDAQIVLKKIDTSLRTASIFAHFNWCTRSETIVFKHFHPDGLQVTINRANENLQSVVSSSSALWARINLRTCARSEAYYSYSDTKPLHVYA